MRQIIELIKKPEWWFSAVFIAIVASLIAAFAKDWISRGLSIFSQAYRTRRLSREAKLDQDAAMLAARSDLLIIEFIVGVAQQIAIITLIGIKAFRCKRNDYEHRCKFHVSGFYRLSRPMARKF